MRCCIVVGQAALYYWVILDRSPDLSQASVASMYLPRPQTHNKGQLA
jgi:hypothetical protein